MHPRTKQSSSRDVTGSIISTATGGGGCKKARDTRGTTKLQRPRNFQKIEIAPKGDAYVPKPFVYILGVTLASLINQLILLNDFIIGTSPMCISHLPWLERLVLSLVLHLNVSTQAYLKSMLDQVILPGCACHALGDITMVSEMKMV